MSPLREEDFLQVLRTAAPSKVFRPPPGVALGSALGTRRRGYTQQSPLASEGFLEARGYQQGPPCNFLPLH